MRRTPYRSADCGLCYGIGCYACEGTGSVSTEQDLDDFDYHMEQLADERRQERDDYE